MRKSLLIFLSKLAVSGLVLAFVFHYTSFSQVAARLESMSVAPLVAALTCLACQAVAIVTWRWHAVLRIIHKTVTVVRLARLVVVGIFFNQILPTTFGGDGVRAWLLSRGEAPIDVALRSVLLDRALGLFALFLLSLAASMTVVVSFDESAPFIGVLILSVTGVIFITSIPVILSLLQKIPWPGFQKHLSSFVQEIGSVLQDKRRLAVLLSVSLFGHALACLAVWLTAHAFGIEIPLGPTLVIVPLVLLAAALPISIAGWGVREGSMVFGLGILGVSSSDAALISVVIGLMGVALGVIGGLVWLLSGLRGERVPDRPS